MGAKRERDSGITTNNSLQHSRGEGSLTLTQQQLDTGELSEKTGDTYGDIMSVKPANTFRIGFQNVNNIPKLGNTGKSKETIKHLKEGEYDLFLMSEVGLYWPKIEAHNSWAERTMFELTNSATFAYNTTANPQPNGVRQFGGTGIVAMQEASARITQRGKDASGLGRWTWVGIQGKEGHYTIVVTAYRPVWNVERLHSVYQQHLRWLAEQQDPRDPITAFDEDLSLQIQQWTKQGFHLIIGMDANCHLDGTSSLEKRLFSLGLDNLFDRSAVPSFGSIPPTCNKSKHMIPIDGIWVSPSIKVSNLGMHGFDEAVPSDHRGIWLDISFSILFGHRSPPLLKGPLRRLNAKDPRLVSRYNKQVSKRFKEENLFKRTEELMEILVAQWTEEHEEMYNKIHARSTEIRKQVENGLRNLRTGGLPWSPKLQGYRNKIELWRMIYKRKTGLKTSITRIRRYMKKTGIRDAMTCTLKESTANLDAAYRVYREAKKDASVWREDYLESLLDALAEKNQTSREKQIQRLRTEESQRRLARSSKRARGKLGKSRVTKVWHTDEQGKKEEASTKQAMETAIMNENISRFRQTEGTPPMSRQFLDLVGNVGEQPALELILQGVPIWEDMEVPPYTREFLEAMKRPVHVPVQETPPHLSVEEHQQLWRKQREHTASEPTAPTFSHFKAANADPQLAQFDANMRSLPYQHGFSPKLWRVITDVSILKKEGMYDVEKMRTIQLMHPEFNSNNKRLGREAMYRAEKHNLIPEDQYGSRKKHRCIRAALNKRLTMDIVRQRKIPAALCSNDAKSCYDRIVHWVANGAVQRTGLSSAPLLSMFRTLQMSTHYISTGFGVSSQGYSAQQFFPLQGIGQGNGCGPAVWALISTILIDMMYQKGHCSNLLSPLSLEALSFVCYAFVDDTDIVHIGEIWSTGEQVAQEMQVKMNRWEGGIRTTGGALVPKKSHWYLVDFEWKNGRWRYRTMNQMLGEIEVTDTDGVSRRRLRRVPINQAEETLGVWLAMDGNNKGAAEALRRKAERLANTLRTSHMAPDEAWYTLTSSVMKTFEYPMEALTVSREQWEWILAPVLTAILPLAKLDAKFPRALVYGPIEEGGLGVMHPWLHQQVSHVVALIMEGMQPTSLTGIHMRHSLELLTLEAGVEGNLFESDFDRLQPAVTECWLTNIWKFACDHRISIHHPLPTLPLWCENDHCLMTLFAEHFSGQALYQLNMCRMFLQVITVSDICTVDGQRITKASWQGIRRQDRFSGVRDWPRAPPTIPSSWWIQWTGALQQVLCTQPYILRQPLHLPLPSHRWHWWFDPELSQLYHLEGAVWRQYRSKFPGIVRVHATKFCPQESWVTELPQRMVPICIFRGSDGVFLDATSHRAEVLLRTEAPQSAPVALPEMHDWIADQIDLSEGSFVQVAASFVQHGVLEVGSDGSYKDQVCTAASVLSDGHVAVSATSVIPGTGTSSSAFRAELGGILTSLALVKEMCRQCLNPGQGTVIISLDGQAALDTAQGAAHMPPTTPCFDLLQLIQVRVEELPCKVLWKWVKGHQRLTPLSPLRVRLNHVCDELAKNRWNEYTALHSRPPAWPGNPSGWTVALGGTPMPCLDKRELYNWSLAHTDLNSTEYWHSKHQVETGESYDKTARATAFRRLTHGRRRWLVKFWSGFCDTGTRAMLRGHQAHDLCPRCGAAQENNLHIVQCQRQGATGVFVSEVAKLKLWLHKVDTDPAIAEDLVNGLRSWFGLQDVPARQTAAGNSQDSIGWTYALQGFLSPLWGHAQAARYLEISSKRSATHWSSLLIGKLWGLVWAMWQHRNSIKHSSARAEPESLRQVMEHEAIRLSEQLAMVPNHELPLLGNVQSYSSYALEIWLGSARNVMGRHQAFREARPTSQRPDPGRGDPTLSGMRKFMSNWLHKRH